MKPSSHHLRGYTLILGSSVVFASYGIWSKMMGDQFGIYYQGWVRALIVLLMITPLMYWRKMIVPIQKEDRRWFWLYIVFTLFTQVPLYYAYIKTGIGAATLMFYAAYVIASYIVGRYLVGEKMTKTKVAALILAFVGLGFVYRQSALVFSAFGLAMAALNGVASGSEVSISKNISSKYLTLTLTWYSWLAILLTHLPVSLIASDKMAMPAFSMEWGAMILYSLAGLLGFWLALEGLRYLDASVASLIGLAEILWAVLFGVLFFQEKITAGVLFGGLAIFTAGLLPDVASLVSRRRKRMRPSSKAVQ